MAAPRTLVIAGALAALLAICHAPQPSLGVMPDDKLEDFVARAVATPMRPILVGARYDPAAVNWSRVHGAWLAVFQYEKRYANFILRAVFHDCFAVVLRTCPIPFRQGSPGCRGCDGSLVSTREEMLHSQSIYKMWAARVAVPVRLIATAFNASLADTIIVGGAAATQYLSNGRIVLLGNGLRVGRKDTLEPVEDGTLPGSDMDTDTFSTFWEDRGLTINEGAALMASHTLLDNHGCQRGLREWDKCDPALQECADDRMYRLDNTYFNDICSPRIGITRGSTAQPANPAVPLARMTDAQFAEHVRFETCGWTSPETKSVLREALTLQRQGVIPTEADDAVRERVSWSNTGCTGATVLGVRSTQCPHATKWPYTVNDAHMGRLCANTTASMNLGGRDWLMRITLRTFLDQSKWQAAFFRGYIKLSERWTDMPDPYLLSAASVLPGAIPRALRAKLQSLERRG